MTRTLTCADVTGDCDAVVTGEDDDAVLDQAVPHAQQVHGLPDSDALREQLRGAIRSS